MMKVTRTEIMFFCFLMVFSILLSGCSGGKTPSSGDASGIPIRTEDMSNAESIEESGLRYVLKPFDVFDKELSVYKMVDTKEGFLIKGTYDYLNTKLISIDKNGNLIKEYALQFENENEYLMDFAVLPDGRIYAFSDESYDDKADTSTMHYYRLYAVSDTEMQPMLKLPNDGSFRVFNLLAGNDYVYMFGQKSGGYNLRAFDENGIEVYEIPLTNNKYVKQCGEKICVFTRTTPDSPGKLEVGVLNEEKQGIENIASFESGAFAYMTDKSVYINDKNSLYRYDLETKAVEYMFDWLNLNLTMRGAEVLAFSDGSDDKFIAIPNGGKKPKLIGKEAVTKEVLTLAVNSDKNMLTYKDHVENFNFYNEKYYIEIKDYSIYENPQSLLNTEIIAGKGPDIIDINSFSPDLISDRLFVDLLPFFEKDKEYPIESLFPSYIEAIKKDGKLLTFIPYFYVVSMYCKPSDFPEGGFNNLGEYINILSAPEAFNGNVIKEDFWIPFFCQKSKDLKRDELIAALNLTKKFLWLDDYRNNTDKCNKDIGYDVLTGQQKYLLYWTYFSSGKYISTYFGEEPEITGLPLSKKQRHDIF